MDTHFREWGSELTLPVDILGGCGMFNGVPGLYGLHDSGNPRPSVVMP